MVRLRIWVLVLLVALPGGALAQTGAGPYQSTYAITRLADGVFTLTWAIAPGTPAIGNATFLVGDHDVILVDTGLSARAGEAIVDGLRKVTDKPVAFVVNTHWHGDHVFGNQSIRRAFPGARFIAHSATRSGIQTGEVDYRDVNRPKMEARVRELAAMPARTEADERELARSRLQIDVWEGEYVLPDVLIDERLTLMQGSRRVDIVHLGSGNTPGDVVVHLPAERIAISGDMAITPVQFAFFSSPREWHGTLGRLAALDAATFVPGHGPVQHDTRFIADLRAMLQSVIDQVDAGVTAGLDLEALKARVTVSPPAGSVYEQASAASFDRNFRLPAIESAYKERR